MSKDSNLKDEVQEEKKVKATKAKTTKRGRSSTKKVKELEAALEEAEKNVQDSKDKYLRLYAEFDNYRKRTAKERLELSLTAGQGVLKSLLPVMDDFERAIKTAEADDNEESIPEGVALVWEKLSNIVKQKGLKEMETAPGTDFDAELHEALTEIPAPTEELKGKIVDTIEKGYYLNDKIIRHARVIVGK